MSNIKKFSSRKEVTEFLTTKEIDTSNWSEEKWLSLNKGQAEIHIMDLAECIYDAMNESTPKQLQAGEWHLPFEDKIHGIEHIVQVGGTSENPILPSISEIKVKISTAMSARTSYTIVGEEKEIKLDTLVRLHDKLITANPLHASPMEHCAQAMSDEECLSFIKGKMDVEEFHEKEGGDDFGPDAYYSGKSMQDESTGWCRNFRGFKQYRYILENQKE